MAGRQNFSWSLIHSNTFYNWGDSRTKDQGTHTLPGLLPVPMAGPRPQQTSLPGACQQRGPGSHAGPALSPWSPLLSEIKCWQHVQSRGGGLGRPAPGRADPLSQVCTGSQPVGTPSDKLALPGHYGGCKQMFHRLSSGPGSLGGEKWWWLCTVLTKPKLDASL